MAGVHIRCIPVSFYESRENDMGKQSGKKVIRTMKPGTRKFPYPVTITFTSGIRAIYLRISRTGKVLVSAPAVMPLKKVEDFVFSKDTWIKEKLAQMPDIPHYRYVSGEKHYFLGHEYPIAYYQNTVSFVTVHEGRLCIVITARTKDFPGAYKKLMKEELQKVIEKYIKIWAPRMGVNPSSFNIRILKSRWGSCNVATGELTFALDLITKPEECIESVVVHELNHLLETGHTPRFHALMARWLPDYKERTKKLYEYPREFI